VIVAEALRERGFVVRTMAEVYPGGADEQVADVEWIRDAHTAGWVALTKDERIIRHPEEQAALQETTLRVFALANQHLRGDQMAGCYVRNLNRILQRALRPGPFVDVVLADAVERRWPRP
jgi:hypothetical protein